MKLISLSLLIQGAVFAANIAVIDSGMDYKHQDLKNNLWTHGSPNVVTSEGTVYENAEHGWNFAESNNQIIDYKYLGTFSADCKKIFHVQGKIMNGKATEEEKAWYKQKKADPEFLKELGKFGNFVHGTHVAGISSAQATESKLLAAKIIPTERLAVLAEAFRKEAEEEGVDANAENPLVKLFLMMIAKKQSQMLTEVGQFVAAAKSEVANGSFGTSVAAAKKVLPEVLKSLLGHEPTEEEVNMYSTFFVEQIVTETASFPAASPNTLFVFAAGNDNTDNDTIPTSPANVKSDNTLTVAATLGVSELASFSNYGKTLVEVAAPGVAIESAIPGDDHLPMSGTSMAAPFVTNVAGRVKDENPALTPKEIKTIIMKTVDVKDFLKGKVSTGGVVNRDRAIEAASLSKTTSLENAIALAKLNVADVRETMVRTKSQKSILVVPLPGLF